MVARVSKNTLRTMDLLAEHMAEGCPTIAEAARRLGITQSWADNCWQRIKRGLGEQAR